MNACSPPSPRRPRSGTIYLVVLGASLIVGALAYGGIVVTRHRQRVAAETTDAAEARRNAESGIDLARLWIRQDSNWRATRPQGAWVTDFPLASGTVTIEATDPTDANFANRPHDSVVLKATGKKGSAKHVVQVTLNAVPDPLPCLSFALQTGGQLWIKALKTATMAPSASASANGDFFNEGTLAGNVQSQGCSAIGTITGTSNFNAGTKVLPAETVADNYAALGTVIAPGALIDKKVLAAGKNPWGALNADGVYVVQPASGDLTIRNSRLYGTLVVICPAGGKVIIDTKILMQPYRSDYPVLIVKGDAEFKFVASLNSFSELGISTNLNPAGAPYNGVTDSDVSDQYPSEIQGLVHVTGKVRVTGTSRIRGELLVGSTDLLSTSIEETMDIQYTPSLITNPPQWYTIDVKMMPQTGSWKQLTN